MVLRGAVYLMHWMRLMWKGSEEVGNVGSECEEVEGTDCEGEHSDTDW